MQKVDKKLNSSGDYRSLLGGGLWISGAAALAAFAYGIVGESYAATSLGLEYLLLTITVWVAANFAHRRDEMLKQSAMSPGANDPSSVHSTVQSPADAMESAVQTQATVLGGVAVLVGAAAAIQLLQQTIGEISFDEVSAVPVVVCLMAAFVWQVLARTLRKISETDLPESRALAFAFREAQWSSLLIATGLVGAAFESWTLYWSVRVLLIWIVVICSEIIVRMILILLIPTERSSVAIAPIRLLLREAIFTASNPVTSLLHTIESHCGVSLRSSWAITFVKRSLIPLSLALIVSAWGMTSLSIVETHQFAIREHFGRPVEGVLVPGLHLSFPWPFGRIRSFPVKTVRQIPIGFVEADEPMQRNQPRTLLWTKPHAKEEFSLVLADGTELVAVNALVYFKISEDPDEFRDYVYQQASPEHTLLAFAYKALMEETRGKTLDDVLSLNRAAFARRIADSVRSQVRTARLGLDVIDFALLNIHPPIEAGGSYLDVINARLDAGRRVTEAEGVKQVALLEAQMRGTSAIAVAKVSGSRRIADARSDIAEFQSLHEGLSAAPKTLHLRLWIEALESALSTQRLFLVDQSLLDEGSELLLDTRPINSVRFPGFETIPRAPGPE